MRVNKMNKIPVLMIVCAAAFNPLATRAQDVLQDSAIEQQQQNIQAEITQGIASGNLSAADIAALQAQQDGLTRQANGGAVAGTANLTNRQLQGTAGNAANGTTTNRVAPDNTASRTTTGPDPFTYNSLGPDAYQSQKYQNPAYNVPAYPTSQPVPAGVNQQYSGPSAGAPYGAGPAQAPGAGGALPQVYVYHPSMSR
jgi:hypothetical protein